MLIKLFFIYQLAVVIAGVQFLFEGEYNIGLRSIICPSLCLYAGAGLKGSILVGNRNEILAGVFMCILFLAISYYFYMKEGLGVIVFEYQISGYLWCIIGFLIGWLSAKREHALPDEEL